MTKHVTYAAIRAAGLMEKGVTHQPRTGNMARLITKLTPDAAQWIYAQTDFGRSPMCDVIADYVEDAYLEDLEKRKARAKPAPHHPTGEQQ